MFLKKAALLLLLLSVLPQIVCLVIRYVNNYYTNVTPVFTETVTNVLDETVSAIGTCSAFCAYAVTVYCAIIFGIKWGSECLIALFAAFIVCYAIMYFSGSYFVSALVMSLLAVMCAVYYTGRNDCFRGVSVLTVLLAVLPYLIAVVLLPVMSPDSAEEALAEGILYGIINLGFDLLILVLAAQTGRYYHVRYAETGHDLTVGGAFLPAKKPVLKANLAVCIIYVCAALLGSIADTVSSISDYGMPANSAEWFTEIYPYIRLIVLFAAGYAVMAFVSNRLEDYYFDAVDTDRLINKGNLIK